MEQMPPSSSEIVSSQKSLPSSYDSGWNDPPEWAMSLQHSSSYGTSSKRLLNKRVAFPISSPHQTSASEKSSPSLPSDMPPASLSSLQITTVLHKPLMTPIVKDMQSLKLSFDKDEALTEVIANLEFVMMEQNIEKNKLQELQKYLNIMKSDWLEDKLNDIIQRSILSISRALRRKDVYQADKMHLDLMMQHAAICHPWISVIRHMIFEWKKEDEEVERLQSPLLLAELEKSKEK